MNMRMVDPYNALVALQRSLANTRQREKFGAEPTSSLAFPPINIFQQNEDYLLVAELPGVDKAALTIQIRNNHVRIAGEKAIKYDDNYSVHRRERLAGSFDRTFELPVEVDTDKAKATYENGMLFVHLPRAEHDKPRTVPIN